MDLLSLVIVLFLVSWLFGLSLFFTTAGGLVHVLLVIAIILIVVRLIRGQSL